MDWEKKIYHREVGKISDFSTIRMRLANEKELTVVFYISILDLKISGQAVCIFTKSAKDDVEKFVVNNTNNGVYIAINKSRLSEQSTEGFRQWCSDNKFEFQYELATPELIDISDILPADNLIEVEAGGTLTFKNQHGDDYRIPVPSEVEHMISIEEAL